MRRLTLVLNFIFVFLFVGCLQKGMETIGSHDFSSLNEPPPSSVPTINVKDKGAVGNGVKDDTDAIQKAIEAVPAGGIVYVPAGTYMIDGLKNIKLKSNMHFKMHKDAVLAAIPNAAERYYVLSVSGQTNVEISGGRLLGERDKHLAKKGEWGYGIYVGKGSKKIKIHDIHISKFWGDGICIGTSEDVEIRNIVSTQNRRQGLSITRAKNVRVYDSEFSYTEGTAPEYGIDIEPDPHADPNVYNAGGIHIENCFIHHNKGGGIQAYKQTFDVVIKKNYLSYNAYGVYTVNSYNGQITENTFAHNRYHGVAIKGASDNYVVSNNIFRNNYTSALGETNDTNPLTSITGELEGNNGTTPHIIKGAEVTNLKILTNEYAK